MKYACQRCRIKKAVWVYVPNSHYFYCDDCISRGCSCNVDPNTGVEDTDEKGRLLPCCEYDYDLDGFDDPDENKYEEYYDWQDD